MGSQEADNCCTAGRLRLMKGSDSVARSMEKVMASGCGDELAESIGREARREFEALIRDEG